jgi:hypothetical protein
MGAISDSAQALQELREGTDKWFLKWAERTLRALGWNWSLQ